MLEPPFGDDALAVADQIQDPGMEKEQGETQGIFPLKSEDVFDLLIRCDQQGFARTTWELSRDSALSPAQ